MKNIIKFVLVFVIGGLIMSSCEEKVSNYESMVNDYDKNNSTYYIQYLNASASYETAIDEAGLPTDIVTTVGVALLGAPQSSDVTVNLVVAPESTMPADAYTLSSTSIVIPAGATSGSVSLTAIADQMTEDETVNLILNMDAAGAEANSATQLNYAMKRIKFCPLTDLAEMAGTFTGFDDYGYAVELEMTVVDDKFMCLGLNREWIQDFWGEAILDEVPIEIIMNPNGTLAIEEQYIFTTEWDGAPYEYNILAGSGNWDNCKKTMIITYDCFNSTDGYALSDYGYAPITETVEMK